MDVLDTLSVPNPNATSMTQGLFGKYITDSSTPAGVIALCGVDEQPDGIVEFTTDGTTTLLYDGILPVTAGGTIAAGAEVKVNSASKAVAVSPGDVPVGRYLGNTSASSGDTIEIQFYRRGRNNVSKSGSVALVTGTATVSTTFAKTGSIIRLSRQAAGGTLGHLSVGTITDSTSFVINSSSATDTSTIFWEILT